MKHLIEKGKRFPKIIIIFASIILVLSVISSSLITQPLIINKSFNKGINGVDIIFHNVSPSRSNKMLTAFYILGAIGAIFSLLFLCWTLFFPRSHSYAFLFLTVAVVCFAFSLAGLSLVLPVYKKDSKLTSDILKVSWALIIALISEACALILSIVTIVFGSSKISKAK